jgi:hypothetical protein
VALGREVNKSILDTRVAEAVLALREAMERSESIAKWLANNPVREGVDPLTLVPFMYSVDEAYLVRRYFEEVEALRVANQTLADLGRKMTGLD